MKQNRSTTAHRLHPLTLAVIATLLPLSAHAADGLTDIGVLNGGTYSSGASVSADGSVMVGNAEDGNGGMNHAFRWTQAGGMVSLGALNGSTFRSYATGVSADGSVVAGYANDGAASDAIRAFRWTQAGGMVSLGVLNGGTVSFAYGVSGDGSVVVGFADDGSAGNVGRAFRWTQAGGMVSLGALNGGNYSTASGVSADGSVVVGNAYDGSASNAERAFRWTQAGGMVSLGALNGGNYSRGTGVSADGSVVVGYAGDGNAANADRAFRWTQAGGMVSLGVLNGGTSSNAYGVSADGKVVVGQAVDGNSNNRAFRWTQAGGMQTVEQWLAANGVAVAAGTTTYNAYATNSDGSVVVGDLDNGHAFLARVSGMIDTVDFRRSLNGSAYTHVEAQAQSDLILNGLHSSPMSGLLGKGQYSAWVGGDWGRQDRGSSNADVGTGEVGVAYGMSNDLMIKLALGHTYSKQDTPFGGNSTLRGFYLMPEVIVGIPNTSLKLTASAYYNEGDADIRRGYLNAGTPVISSGKPDTQSEALRLRLDWLNAYTQGKLSLTPYTNLTWFHSHINGYTESGGGFPVRWDGRDENTNQARLGTDGTYALNDTVKLLGRLEAVHRMENRSSNISGTILGPGGGNFGFSGIGYRQDWLRAGIGAEAKAGPGVVSVMLNGTTENDGASYWAYANYRVTF
ncbi:MAG TPA: autotransporter domain-containing protein [Rhodocyclaceae bacterium]|nr:autotransporter domain-containing protein [Rhodocyclaceae bacterium]